MFFFKLSIHRDGFVQYYMNLIDEDPDSVANILKSMGFDADLSFVSVFICFFNFLCSLGYRGGGLGGGGGVREVMLI